MHPTEAECPKGKTQIITILFVAIRGATPRPYNPRRKRDASPIYLRLLPTGGFLSGIAQKETKRLVFFIGLGGLVRHHVLRETFECLLGGVTPPAQGAP